MDLEPKPISPGADKLRSKLFQKRKGLRKAQKILIILIVPLGTKGVSGKDRIMKILNLTLQNFIQAFAISDLDTQGKDANIYGDNARQDNSCRRFYRLLFDKDSANRKDFQIKTLGPDGEPEHGLDHSVEAILRLKANHLALKKIYKEVVDQKRGSATAGPPAYRRSLHRQVY